MRLLRLPLLALTLTFAADGVQAQGFFERLFGLAPLRNAPPPPPVAPQAVPAPATLPPSGEEPQRRAAPPPVQARPVSLRVPTEDGVIGRELKQNGSNGSIRIERTGGSDLRARLTLVGRRSAQSVETCSVALGGPQGAPLTSQGRPDGIQRYSLQDATCPLQLDILDEAVLIKGAGEACLFQSANCQIDATGLWGPEASQLLPKARDYEASRGAADKSVRDNYKVLVQRSRPESVRSIVAEQAAFSSEREVLCRSYAREGSHSFCNARFSEARVISLAQRLGIAVASNQATPTTTGSQATISGHQNEVRVRRRNDPYGIPPADEIVQGNPLDTE